MNPLNITSNPAGQILLLRSGNHTVLCILRHAMTLPFCLGVVSGGFSSEARAVENPLPDYVDNSQLPSFPPVTSQGPTGACAVFAAYYYQMTHMAGLANGYNNKTSKANVFGPNWTMNFGVGGTGCYIQGKMNGCASWEDIPFTPEPGDWNRDPAVWARALKHRVEDSGTIGNIDTPEGFYRMKELLSEGHVLYFDTWIGSFQFIIAGDDPSTTKDDAYVGKNVIYGVDDYVAGHALAIVGYNDHVWVDINGNGKVDPGEKGVIKVVNSWGAAYEDRGFTYVAYDGLRENSIVEGVPEKRRFGSVFNHNTAYWVTFKKDYYPRLLGQVTLNTQRRNQVKVQLGYSTLDEEEPKYTWDSFIMNNQGGPTGFDGTDNAIDGTFVFDFTDLMDDNKLEGSGRGRWYVSVTDSEADGNPVLIKDFTLIDNITKRSGRTSLDLPMSADGSTAHVYVEYSPILPDDEVPPTAPQKLTVKTAFANTVTLEWAESTDNIAIKHYQVFRDRKPYITTEINSISETNLPLGESYTYHVAAIDTSNNRSAVSNPVAVEVKESAEFDTGLVYSIINKKSGKALSVAQGTFLPGVPFVQYNYSNQGMQHFIMAEAGDGSYYIKTKPGIMLLQVDSSAMDDGSRVVQWEDNGSDSCKWIMIPSGQSNTFILSNKNTGKVLAVVGGSKDEGGFMEQTTFTKDDSQLWVIKRVAE